MSDPQMPAPMRQPVELGTGNALPVHTDDGHGARGPSAAIDAG